MKLGFDLAYRLGFTPWERNVPSQAAQFARLLDREAADRTPPYGRAVDLGCGRGWRSLLLSERGWQVTGVDKVGRAVDRARQRPGAAAVAFVVGDVTGLDACGVAPGVDFFLDAGCLHSLPPPTRRAAADSISAHAAPGATMLSMAFAPTPSFLTPPGVRREEMPALFPEWTLLDVEPALLGMPTPIASLVAPQWYRLRKR